MSEQSDEQERQGVEQERQGVEQERQAVVQGATAAQLDDLLASPRLNEQYRFVGKHFTRWRLIQATALIFALITMIGLWQVRNNADRIEQEAKNRRIEICAAVQQGFDGVHTLLDRLVIPAPNPDGTPRVLTPEQQNRIAEIERTADEVLNTQDCFTRAGG